MATVCRSCREPVLWVVTEASKTRPGRRMPLDATPDGKALVVQKGNILLTAQRAGDGTPIVRYVKDGLHQSHFASCPNAAKHRKPARAH